MKQAANNRVGAFRLWALLPLLLAGCGDDRSTRSVEPLVPELRNCLVVVLDAARARNCSFLGASRETTPFLDELAASGVAFGSAYSQATSTSPSAWSYLTGRYPYWPEAGSAFLVQDEEYTLAEAFDRAGFGTGGFSENPYVRERYGFDQGFGTFEYFPYFDDGGGSSAYTDQFKARPSDRVVEGATHWLDKQGSDPWFCYVHLLRPHTPYTAPASFAGRFVDGDSSLEQLREREAGIMDGFFGGEMPSEEDARFLEDLYDGNLAYGDSLVRELVEHLEARGVLESTLIVVVSDHGEGFMEHGRLLHSSVPYEELIHVPLLVWAPEAAGFEARLEKKAVELLDLYPTLAEIFGLVAEGSLDGLSRLDLLRDSTAPGSSVVIAENRDTLSVAVKEGSQKLIVGLEPSMSGFERRAFYDLAADPGERENVIDLRGSEAARLLSLATEYVESRSSGVGLSRRDLSMEEQEELRALGYVE